MPQVNVYAADGSGRVVRTQWVDDSNVTALQEGGGWADQSGAWHDIPSQPAPPAPRPTLDPTPLSPPPGAVLEADTARAKAEAAARQQQYLEQHPERVNDPDAIARRLEQVAWEREQAIRAQLTSPLAGPFESPEARQQETWRALGQAREDPYGRNILGPTTASGKIQRASKVPVEHMAAAQLAALKLGGATLKPEQDAIATHFLANFSPEQAQEMASKFHEASAKSSRGKMATAAAIAVSMISMVAAPYAVAALTPALGGAGAGAAVGGGVAAAGAGTQAGITGEWDPQQIALQVAAGAATGGLGSALSSVGLSPALAGGLTGAAQGLAKGAATGDLSWQDILTGAGVGAAQGGLSQSLGGERGSSGPLGGLSSQDISRLAPWLKLFLSGVTRGLEPGPPPLPGRDPRLGEAEQAHAQAVAQRGTLQAQWAQKQAQQRERGPSGPPAEWVAAMERNKAARAAFEAAKTERQQQVAQLQAQQRVLAQQRVSQPGPPIQTSSPPLGVDQGSWDPMAWLTTWLNQQMPPQGPTEPVEATQTPSEGEGTTVLPPRPLEPSQGPWQGFSQVMQPGYFSRRQAPYFTRSRNQRT